MSTMKFEIKLTNRARTQLTALETANDKKLVLKAVRKTLGYMETNIRHPSLRTHKFDSLKGTNGEDVFEAYVQNNTPCAWRIFWHYGPAKTQITIVAITAHP